MQAEKPLSPQSIAEQVDSCHSHLLPSAVPSSAPSLRPGRPSHHREIRRLFPHAQIQTVPNAGHWVHADRPQDFMAAVRSFLA